MAFGEKAVNLLDHLKGDLHRTELVIPNLQCKKGLVLARRFGRNKSCRHGNFLASGDILCKILDLGTFRAIATGVNKVQAVNGPSLGAGIQDREGHIEGYFSLDHRAISRLLFYNSTCPFFAGEDGLFGLCRSAITRLSTAGHADFNVQGRCFGWEGRICI